jgi:hypothetical protein
MGEALTAATIGRVSCQPLSGDYRRVFRTDQDLAEKDSGSA